MIRLPQKLRGNTQLVVWLNQLRDAVEALRPILSSGGGGNVKTSQTTRGTAQQSDAKGVGGSGESKPVWL